MEIVHFKRGQQATKPIGVDKKYAERKIEAKKRGYKWGAYHYGKPGDAIKQADFFLETVKPEPDDLMPLDLESTDFEKHMSFHGARVFINRIKEKTGRYPLVYANHLVVKAINDATGVDDVFSRTPLWYARFKPVVTDFPKATHALAVLERDQLRPPQSRILSLHGSRH